MKKGKSMAIVGLIGWAVLFFLSLFTNFSYEAASLMRTISYVFGLVMLVGIVLMIINKTVETGKDVKNKKIPKAIGSVKRTTAIAQNRMELDRELSEFLNQNGGLWILKMTTGDIILYDRNGKEISFNAPAKGYTGISSQYAQHVANKYKCEIEQHYEEIGGDDVRVNLYVDYKGDLSSNISGGPRNGPYLYSMLYSKEYMKLEEKKKREYLMEGPRGKRV